jgi:cytidylate kinase
VAKRPGSILLITGPPGAGKTTVGRLVADTYDLCVLLHGDDFFHCIHRGYIPPWQPESDDQNQIVIDAMAAAAISYALGGYAVIVEGIVGPWLLERWLGHVPLEIPMHYVVLLPSPAVALRRATHRPGANDLVDPQPVTFMYHVFVDRNDHDHYTLDTSDLTAEATAGTVLDLVATNRLLVRGEAT